jgi:pyruvate kinase
MKIKKTKIISTIGPSSDSSKVISQLIKKGMDVARINMAHTNKENDIKSLVSKIRYEAKKLGKNIAIMMDIAGPKIRVNLIKKDIDILVIVKNHIYTMGNEVKNDIPINLSINFKKHNKKNALVKVDDGRISFKVISIRNNILKIKALESGSIISGKGVNFPNIELAIPSITKKDIHDINLGIKYNIDWFSLSFVRFAKDIKPIINIFNRENIYIPVIAKIEKPEAILNLDEIIDKFDGILVARGDLGVEESLAKVPVLQKNIIEKCTKAKKPVIVATQILESMIENSSPTRAEVNDVANSVYDGVDAVMLSGETAIGKYPIDSVSIMSEIINDVENSIETKIGQVDAVRNDNRIAIGHAVRLISKSMDIDGIVVMSESGATARVVSHYRPNVIIYGMSPHIKICNRMALFWGVVPIQTKSFKSTDDMIINAEKILIKKKLMKKGETFILTAGIPIGVSGSTNMIQIQKINKE